jgi:hypothetical protein
MTPARHIDPVMTVTLPLLTFFCGDLVGRTMIVGGANVVSARRVARTIPAASTPVTLLQSMLISGTMPTVVPSPWTSIS